MAALKPPLLLNWPGHHRCLVDSLWNLLQEQYKVDVEMSCNGHIVRSHQLVLAMFLPGFKEILQSREDRIVNMDGIVQNGNTVKLILEFIYTGKVKVEEENLDSVLALAENLGLKELIDSVEKAQKKLSSKTENQVNGTFKKSSTLTDAQVKQHKNHEEIVDDDIINNYSSKNDEVNSDNKLSCTNGGKSRSPSTICKKLSRKDHNHQLCEMQPIMRCQHCTFRTQCTCEMETHSLKHDPSFKRHKCDICGKCFTGNKSFKKHLLIHGEPSNLFSCKLCDFSTTDNQRLLIHLNVCHKVDAVGKPITAEFKCEKCDFAALNKVQLRSHNSRKHNPKNCYKCDECDYTAITHRVIARHVSMVHRNERPFMCELCGARQKTENHLKEHMRAHAGFKPHKCEICNKDFARVTSLKMHLRLHSGVSRFVCNICGGGFQKRYRFAAHLQRQHNLEFEAEKGHVNKGSFLFPIILTDVNQDVNAEEIFVHEEANGT